MCLNGYLQVDCLRKGLEVLYFLLHFGDCGVEFIELFELEEAVADGTLEQHVQRHKVEVII